MAELPLTGGCLCGAVRYELTEAPGPALYCHCTRCQRRTGSAASAQARIDGSALRVVEGERFVRGYRPPDGFEKLFCAECGSQLFSRNPAEPSDMSVRLGSFDEDPGVRPSWRQFVAFAAAWEPIPDDGLPRFQGSRRGAAAAEPE